MILVPLSNPKFATLPAEQSCELRVRGTSIRRRIRTPDRGGRRFDGRAIVFQHQHDPNPAFAAGEPFAQRTGWNVDPAKPGPCHHARLARLRFNESQPPPAWAP